MVQNPLVNAGAAGVVGSIHGYEDPLEKVIATHSSILAWRIPLTEKPGSYSSRGHKKWEMTELRSMHNNEKLKQNKSVITVHGLVSEATYCHI